MPQNEGFIWAAYLRISSPRLKKILDFDDLMGPRMKDLNHFSQNILTMVEENFYVDDLKFPRMMDLNHLWKLNVASFANLQIPVVKIPIDAVALYLHFMDF